jgi:hypothetical protein
MTTAVNVSTTISLQPIYTIEYKMAEHQQTCTTNPNNNVRTHMVKNVKELHKLQYITLPIVKQNTVVFLRFSIA